jgi:N-acetylneuraminate synthase
MPEPRRNTSPDAAFRFSIANRPIGPSEPPYVVAELSANHRGELARALRIIDAAADCGADAVKFQAYTPDTLTIDCQSPAFRLMGTIWEGRTLYDLYREAHTPWEWMGELKRAAESRGLAWFASAFDPTSVELLEALAAPAYKIASFELVDIPLLERVAATGKPVIVSTGMATLEEIDEAVRAIGPRRLSLLHCVSSYPARPEDMHLRAIPLLAERFGVPVGLSDHTLGPATAVAAVALGACIVEKHLTLGRQEGGPDAAFSLEPDEFRHMTRCVRSAWHALGDARIAPAPSESAGRRLRRSLFVVADIRAGEPFTPQNVRSIRPGDGLHPRYYAYVLGRPARDDIARGTPLSWQHVG